MAAAQEQSTPAVHEASAPVHLPRITIKFCTQCKWMLRAAYYAQELISTFSTSLGEVALVPATGGVFTIEIVHLSTSTTGPEDVRDTGKGVLKPQTARLWDRKAEGGFPETKQLKKLVRDIIEPSRDLGHVDRHGSKPKPDHHTNNNPVVEPQPENQPTSPQRPLPIINNNNPMAINSAAENMVASIMSAHPDRPKNDDRSHQPTPAEVAATQTANKLVADIMNGFQEGVAKSGNREFVGESRGLGMRQEGDMTDDGVDDGSDEVQTVHSARQGCEDCG